MSALPDGFEIVAETGDRFASFAPYVPAIANDGTVAFQAELRAGSTGVYVWQSGALLELARDPGVEFVSHPDLNVTGDVCVYGRARNNTRLITVGTGLLEPISPLGIEVGPLGPTMNQSGAIAFRGTQEARPGIFKLDEGGGWIVPPFHSETTLIAQAGKKFTAFHGLPIVRDSGVVVFRADLTDGRQGIYLSENGLLSAVVETGEEWSQIGLFPSANDEAIVFAATHSSGPGIFVKRNGTIEPHIQGESQFRGAIIAGGGRIIYFATPPGGELGIYENQTRLVAIGDHQITELALNSVSINHAGHFAIRLKFQDGREAIAQLNC